MVASVPRNGGVETRVFHGGADEKPPSAWHEIDVIRPDQSLGQENRGGRGRSNGGGIHSDDRDSGADDGNGERAIDGREHDFDDARLGLGGRFQRDGGGCRIVDGGSAGVFLHVRCFGHPR